MSMGRLYTLLLSVFLISCAVEPQQAPSPKLLKTEWLLEDLGGKGVLDRAQATLAFPDEKKVAGNASCNRFFGTVEISGNSIKFGALGSTRMACRGEALANQESNYLRALENADRFNLEGPYLLIHSKGMEKPLRFTKLTLKSKP